MYSQRFYSLKVVHHIFSIEGSPVGELTDGWKKVNKSRWQAQTQAARSSKKTVHINLHNAQTIFNGFRCKHPGLYLNEPFSGCNENTKNSTLLNLARQQLLRDQLEYDKAEEEHTERCNNIIWILLQIKYNHISILLCGRYILCTV